MNAPFDDHYIQLLAHKWKQGTLTEQEKADFLAWYNEHNDEYLELSDNYAKDKEALQERIFSKIITHINPPDKQSVVPLRRTWFRIVAAASLIAAIGITLYFITHKVPDPQATAAPILASQVAPGANKAILQLSSGQTIDLNSAGNSMVSGEKDITIRNQENGSLIYSAAGNAINQANNSLTTPKGGQYHIQLPDGTKVWLNADSRLDFPVSFAGKEQRIVSLIGEAYFEVAKDKKHPFIVRTDRQEVKVLGTHFNINSYKDEGPTVTTLEEGAVRVSSGNTERVIRPGEQTTVASVGQITIGKADMDRALAWRRSEMVFRDASIQEVMRQIARWYDLQIEYQGKISGDTFTGTLDRSANLDTILRMLATNPATLYFGANISR